MMAESTKIHTKADGELIIGGAANSASNTWDTSGNLNIGAPTYTVSYEAGDLSVQVPGPAVSNFLDRGKITSPPSIRLADDGPITFSFTAYLRHITDGSATTLFDLLNNTGAVAAGFVSTTSTSNVSDDAEVFTVDLRWNIENQGDSGDTHFVILSNCFLTYSVSEGDPNSISISGTSYSVQPYALG